MDHEEDDSPSVLMEDPRFADRWRAAAIPAQRVRLHLAAGEYELARRAVDDAAERLRMDARTSLRDTLLSQTPLPLKLTNALEKHLDVVTIGQALAISPEEMQAAANVGKTSVVALLRAIASHCVRHTLAVEDELAAAKGHIAPLPPETRE